VTPASDAAGPVDDAASAGPVVRAAGGAVWRHCADGLEVLLVHRPRYDDWTLPKGKAELGEDDEATALREVAEETGLECDLGPELTPTHYVDHNGRAKVVRYWAMTAKDPIADFVPNREVDDVAWLAVHEATARLTYERDRPVLAALTDAL